MTGLDCCFRVNQQNWTLDTAGLSGVYLLQHRGPKCKIQLQQVSPLVSSYSPYPASPLWMFDIISNGIFEVCDCFAMSFTYWSHTEVHWSRTDTDRCSLRCTQPLCRFLRYNTETCSSLEEADRVSHSSSSVSSNQESECDWLQLNCGFGFVCHMSHWVRQFANVCVSGSSSREASIIFKAL